jgi:hypothetical protein
MYQARVRIRHALEKILGRGHVARKVVSSVERLGDAGEVKHQVHAVEGQVEAVAGN